ncbi:MAG: hypothetical protein AVDCRST_MAG68-5263, partial [uncultured Gemmatimonadetes bacterium]
GHSRRPLGLPQLRFHGHLRTPLGVPRVRKAAPRRRPLLPVRRRARPGGPPAPGRSARRGGLGVRPLRRQQPGAAPRVRRVRRPAGELRHAARDRLRVQRGPPLRRRAAHAGGRGTRRRRAGEERGRGVLPLWLPGAPRADGDGQPGDPPLSARGRRGPGGGRGGGEELAAHRRPGRAPRRHPRRVGAAGQRPAGAQGAAGAALRPGAGSLRDGVAPRGRYGAGARRHRDAHAHGVRAGAHGHAQLRVRPARPGERVLRGRQVHRARVRDAHPNRALRGAALPHGDALRNGHGARARIPQRPRARDALHLPHPGVETLAQAGRARRVHRALLARCPDEGRRARGGAHAALRSGLPRDGRRPAAHRADAARALGPLPPRGSRGAAPGVGERARHPPGGQPFQLPPLAPGEGEAAPRLAGVLAPAGASAL